MMRQCILGSAVLVIALSVFSSLFNFTQAQPQTAKATTDPYEAGAINSIFSKWRILDKVDNTQWNISGEICSGAAIDTTTTIDDGTYNPFIKCDCSFNKKTTCRITALNLAQNYLTGSLPPAIGNLTRMQYMSFGINALSGELPKELGNLTQLISLAFGSNKLTGSLPYELGKLVKLEQL
ncbi:hypothetical protein TSUD_152470 [Trifolium subterraneum]|uniref:Leucine-rich repeat-containing N-terminal plant-type domain-containing protein n=1 Tax=Trifolium subterraneum TaxID=3900 RepID=A0A2Z6MKK2_TRISU|nr:hypothetical protein TSUD_152470 [Trifolium subterraneum]